MFGLGVPLTFVVLVLVAIISGIKILKEYERAVVFRLGRMVGVQGPGVGLRYSRHRKDGEAWIFARSPWISRLKTLSRGITSR